MRRMDRRTPPLISTTRTIGPSPLIQRRTSSRPHQGPLLIARAGFNPHNATTGERFSTRDFKRTGHGLEKSATLQTPQAAAAALKILCLIPHPELFRIASWRLI
jgi:hypothetical protein